MFDLTAVQAALAQEHIPGWLLYDFRGLNPLARGVLDIAPDAHTSRRFFYLVPQQGEPIKLSHRIEPGTLRHLPGRDLVYSSRVELRAQLEVLLRGLPRVAMEFAPLGNNPYISRVDAGTVDLVRELGCEVVSSGDLIQRFEALLSPAQWASHLRAAEVTNTAFTAAWNFIRQQTAAGGTTNETAVREVILDHFRQHGLAWGHPPIVGVDQNAGSPHYETGTGADTDIRAGRLVLIDLWGRFPSAEGIYSDLTRMAFVGADIPPRMASVFGIVCRGRDAALNCIQQAVAAGTPVAGWQPDRACRQVIEAAGFGEWFTHRTGHSLGAEVHGNGAHLDDFETREERQLLPRALFTIEPGIYLPEFGCRSEINVYLDDHQQVITTGGLIQTEIERLIPA